MMKKRYSRYKRKITEKARKSRMLVYCDEFDVILRRSMNWQKNIAIRKEEKNEMSNFVPFSEKKKEVSYVKNLRAEYSHYQN